MTARKWIGPKEIGALMEVARGLGIHPEAVRIPLDAEGSGSVRIENGRLLIVAPAEGGIPEFIAGLPARIAALEGVGALKKAE